MVIFYCLGLSWICYHLFDSIVLTEFIIFFSFQYVNVAELVACGVQNDEEAKDILDLSYIN